MTQMINNNKKIELWSGYEVEINEDILDDFDFMADLNDAQKNNDLKLLMQCIFGLIGGDDVFNEVRNHITKEKGYFSTKELMGIVAKVSEALPKVGKVA